MRLTILGGGGFRVPLVYGALLAGSPITEVVLYDVDRSRLSAITRVLLAFKADTPRILATTDLTEALTGAAFIFSAIRVHGLRGRVIDENIARQLGTLGQETVGAGGVSYGLRTVPVATALARRIALSAPDAWVINFTNPAGLVTEAMAAQLGDRVIGICDSPSALARRAVRAAGAPPAQTRVSYAGLNHLGWLTAITHGGRDLLPGLLADPAALESFEEGRLFGAAKLRELSCIPNEYLHYYYDHLSSTREDRPAALGPARSEPEPHPSETPASPSPASTPDPMSGLLFTGEGRGAFLMRQQTDCYAELLDPGADPLAVWKAALRERDATYMADEGLGQRDDAEGGGYEEVALALMNALATGAPADLILNVRNRHGMAPLDTAAVVEVPCRVDADGATPYPGATIPAHGVDLVRRVKATDRAILDAAAAGSRAIAVRAMAAHPLIDSVPLGRRLITAYQENFPELDYLR